MKEIIEPGKKSFVLTCSHCGCKFSYELGDIGCADDVYCPDCHNRCFHPRQGEENEYYYQQLPIYDILGQLYDILGQPINYDYRSTAGHPPSNPGVTTSCEDKDV